MNERVNGPKRTLHAGVKLALVGLTMTAILMNSGPRGSGYAFTAWSVVITGIWVCSGVTMRDLVRASVFLLGLDAILVLSQGVFVRPAGMVPVLWIPSWVPGLSNFMLLTKQGVEIGGILALKASAMVLAMRCLVSTTSLEELVSTLRVLGLPFRFAGLIGIAAQQVNEIERSWARISLARRVQGALGVGKSAFGRHWEDTLSSMVTVIYLMSQRSAILEYSLASRCYYRPGRRVIYPRRRISAADYVVIAAAVGWFVVLFCLPSKPN